jgi:TadE-like protein
MSSGMRRDPHARRPACTRSRTSESGTAAVEFALVLPLVLTVALALVQIGLVVRDRLLVESAARAGARGHYLSRGSPGWLTFQRVVEHALEVGRQRRTVISLPNSVTRSA